MPRFTLTPKAMRLSLAALAMLPLALLSQPALAVYKVVGPDGKIVYTDKPPETPGTKVSVFTTRLTPSPNENLPFELKRVAERYPVTLFVVAAGCGPCDEARRFLSERGVPFQERTVGSVADQDELLKITGGRDLPALTLGAQSLRGFALESWAGYLTAAGYPKTSQLPSSYRPPKPQALTEPAPVSSKATAAKPPAATEKKVEPPVTPPPGSLRF